MPVYNSAAWIASAIESILAQSWRNLELVISDNASTDSTFAICERYAREDPRIRLYRNAHNIGANRNYAAVLRHARAPYFKWASSNDICAPTFIDECVRALESDSAAVLAFTQAALFEDDVAHARPYDGDVLVTSTAASERLVELFRSIRLNNAFNGVIRTEALLSALPLGSYQRADIALMAELALMGTFLLVPKELFFRRMSVETATKLKSAREVDEHIEPDVRRPLHLQNWRFYLALLRAVLRRQPSAETAKALIYVLRQMRRSRVHLARDLWQAMVRLRW